MYFIFALDISLSTQIMHCLVFAARYLDLLNGSFISIWNTSMKIWYIVGSSTTVVVLVCAQKPSPPEQRYSTISQILYPTLLSMLLALCFNYSYSLSEITWSFSIFLASIADVPQLMEYERMEKKDRLLTVYLILCFAFRAFYFPYWILRCVSKSLNTASYKIHNNLLLIPFVQIHQRGCCRPYYCHCWYHSDVDLHLLRIFYHPSSLSPPSNCARHRIR